MAYRPLSVEQAVCEDQRDNCDCQSCHSRVDGPQQLSGKDHIQGIWEECNACNNGQTCLSFLSLPKEGGILRKFTKLVGLCTAQSCFRHQPVTGHPQVTHTTAAKMSWEVRCLKTQAAAQVSMYMAKLLGRRLVEEVNIPHEKVSSTNSLLLMDTPA